MSSGFDFGAMGIRTSCFEKGGVDNLSVDEHGDKWDVCIDCEER